MSEKKKITKRRQRSRPGELPQILKTAHGSAYMNYKGSRYFLGTYGSEDAEKERRRIVAEVEAGKSISPKRSEPITVSMLVVRFLDWAQKKYRKNGRSTGSYERFKLAVQPLLSLYATLPVPEFRPLALRAVRQIMVDSGRLCRKTVNTRIGLICQIFRWGLGYELVPAENVTALEAVDPLRPGEEPVREMDDVEEVELPIVLKTLPLLSPAVAAMVKLQAMTGMRPGEVTAMRPADLYREGDKFPKGYRFGSLRLKGCWIYIPYEHKTDHHKNKIRFVVITESCQRILEPFLKRQGHEDYIFSPAAEHEIRMAKLRANRKTKVGKRNMNVGDVLSLSNGKATTEYDRIVEWSIPDSRDAWGRYQDNNRHAHSRGPQDTEPWDMLRFCNPLPFPMTTAPATIVSNQRFFGQNASFWAGPKEMTKIPITKSMSVRVNSTEFERMSEANQPAQPKTVKRYGYQYREATIDVELTIVNRRAEPVKMLVKRGFSGELEKKIDDATIHVLNEDLSSVNRKHEIQWEFDLPSGETKKLTYSYVVLIRL